ncbi:MAG: anaerobic ribonucleoside-triphosphate reductase activating protein [Opitutales bacterium]|nr:anaerobic ribonucleoside-triphosphate reductase activating protein [Opitutales bacterium]
MNMEVGNIIRHSDRDFPGRQAAVLFLIGCNFRCPYCAFGSLIDGRGLARIWSEAQVFQFLESARERLDGVVFSGGEPTLHPGLSNWIRRARDLGYAIKLDTNGSQPDVLRQLIVEGLVDYIAMDVKAPLENYSQLCGRKIDTEAIRSSVWVIKQSGVAHEFRTTVIPGMHTVRELKMIADLVHGADLYAVQDFVSKHTLRPDLRNRLAFPDKPLNDMRGYVLRRVERFEVRHDKEARPMPAFGRRRSSARSVETANTNFLA